MNVFPKELDFIWRLNDYINTLGLYARSNVGGLEDKDSISLLPMPGGEEIVYMDGSRDKHYQIQIDARSNSQRNCIEALSIIASTLENLQSNDIESNNNSFDFESIKITSLPNILVHSDQGFFIYALNISAKITIYKE